MRGEYSCSLLACPLTEYITTMHRPRHVQALFQSLRSKHSNQSGAAALKSERRKRSAVADRGAHRALHDSHAAVGRAKVDADDLVERMARATAHAAERSDELATRMRHTARQRRTQ